MSTRRSRIRVRRQPKRGRYDREAIHAALDCALMGHVAFVDDGQPYCIPMLVARVREQLYVHGSTASRAMRTLAAGAPACITVTSLHGLVLARSVFNHSANYESALVLGRFRVIEEREERLAALEAFSEKLLPGRCQELNAAKLQAALALGDVDKQLGRSPWGSRPGASEQQRPHEPFRRDPVHVRRVISVGRSRGDTRRARPGPWS